jgi:hypothetical protein
MIYFASGSNRPGDVRGLDDAGQALGVAVPELSPRAMTELASVRVPVFVDSGAFSEVEFGPTGPNVVRPLGAEHWSRVFGVYRALAGLEAGAWLVAPDMVGNQVVTLERLERYASELRQLHRAGARIIVPIQKGELSMAAFADRAAELLALPFVCGVPMKKDATSIGELRAFLAEWRPAAVHLLGLGPESPRYGAAAAAVERAGALLTCDSVRLKALVGRRNGRGGGPRPLTLALDEATDELAGECWAATDGMDPIDFTDSISEPSSWLRGRARTAFLDELASIPYATTDDVVAARADLDAWLITDAPNGIEWALDPLVELALERAWAHFHHRETGSERKRRAVRAVFSEESDDAPLLPGLEPRSHVLCDGARASARDEAREQRPHRAFDSGAGHALREGEQSRAPDASAVERVPGRPRAAEGQDRMGGDVDAGRPAVRRMGRGRSRPSARGDAHREAGSRLHDDAADLLDVVRAGLRVIAPARIRAWMKARVGPKFCPDGHPSPRALAIAARAYHARFGATPKFELYERIAREVFDAWETSGAPPTLTLIAGGGR